MTLFREKSERVSAKREVNPAPAISPDLTFWRLYFMEMRPYLDSRRRDVA